MPTPIDRPQTLSGTRLLQAITPFRERRVIVILGAPKHQNLGRLVSGILPRHDGTFLIEIGAVLSDHLPSLHGQHEYSLAVPASPAHATRQLFFSNQMVRVRWSRDNDPLQVICPLYRLDELRSGPLAAPPEAHVEYLSTVVTAQYGVPGTDPEHALSSHIYDAVGDFVSSINAIANAHCQVAREEWGILTPVYDYGAFDHFYLLIAGADAKRVVQERLALNAFRVGLGSPTYKMQDEATFRSLVSGETSTDDVVFLLRAARSYIEGGILNLALVQLAIAAELATGRFVRQEYARRRASTKLPAFATMLNREVSALAPPESQPDRQLLQVIDQVRTYRNNMMHEGKFAATVNDLRRWHAAVKSYVSFLRSLKT